MKQTKFFENFNQIYEQQIAKYTETFEAISRISHILSKADIEHAIFKTLRPYIFTTVDIDIIIFGNIYRYERACKAVQNAGYRKIVRGPMSTTLEDPKMKIGVDLYNEVAVSYVPYIDKTKLIDFITDTTLPNQEQVKTLRCEADLISVIAHSVVKENMYTLSEYYSFVYYLQQLNVDDFVQLVEKTHLKSATTIHIGITALLYKIANGNLPNKLQKVLAEIGIEGFETAMVIKKDFEMPHKYHFSTVARCLFEIVHNGKTRKGIARQIFNSLNPSFSKDFFKKLVEHATRETY